MKVTLFHTVSLLQPITLHIPFTAPNRFLCVTCLCMDILKFCFKAHASYSTSVTWTAFVGGKPHQDHNTHYGPMAVTWWTPITVEMWSSPNSSYKMFHEHLTSANITMKWLWDTNCNRCNAAGKASHFYYHNIRSFQYCCWA